VAEVNDSLATAMNPAA